MSQDDGFFFDGKPEDFEWKVVGHKEALRFVDPDSIAGKVKERELPGGGWRTVAINNDRTVGYMVKDWKGVPWGPVAAAVAKRKFWVLEGVPKDKYYLYGKMELWIDDTTWAGAWNRKFSWQGDLLNTLQTLGYATHQWNDKERWWGATMSFQLAENIRQDRATASGMNGPGTDPPNDRRGALPPGGFVHLKPSPPLGVSRGGGTPGPPKGGIRRRPPGGLPARPPPPAPPPGARRA